jgi:peptide chain release factor subunit 1
LIQQYFDEISHDTGKYCFGVDDTLRGLEMGAVETLIVWENLDVTRHYLRDSTGAEHIVHVHAPPPAANTSKAVSAEVAAQGGINALSEQDRLKFLDKTTGLEMEQSKEPQPLLEWLAENYQNMGAQLEVS